VLRLFYNGRITFYSGRIPNGGCLIGAVTFAIKAFSGVLTFSWRLSGADTFYTGRIIFIAAVSERIAV
jgi:hypothetical protein